MGGITNSMEMEFEQALGDGEGQGSLVCCRTGGHREADASEELNTREGGREGLEHRT